MANQNFEGFKPLNEEEEKKIAGGVPANLPNPCTPIEQEIDIIEQQVQMLQKQHLPVPPGMQMQLQQLEQQYQKCMAVTGGR